MTTLTFLIGTFSLVLSVVTIIILFLLRKNIVDILNKDTIIFSKNFEIKKSAFDKAMYIVDEIKAGAPRSKSAEYMRKINQIYNELLCVSTDPRIADVFIAIATETEKVVTSVDVANFKLLCRKDLGFNNKKSALANQLKSDVTKK